MRFLWIYPFLSLLFVNCFSISPKETHIQSSGILKRLTQILPLQQKLSLFLYTPPELQSNLCNNTEEFLESLLMKGDELLSSVLLEQFQRNPQFQLMDPKTRKFALHEQKFQMLGFTQTDVLRIGSMTGANFLAISSSTLDCTAGNRELTYEKTTRLIQTEMGTLEALDRMTLKFKWNFSKKQFEFWDGSLNGEKISFPEDFY
jgi:hypothetical protein